MDEKRLAQSIAGYLDPSLAAALAADFIKIRQDYATKTLERASPGKFAETFVQCLQWIATGAYDAKPDVDAYLRTAEHETKLPDGLRFCGSRIARTIYTLRNKRNIAHKNEIDPNTVDLCFIHHAASWIMAELIRSATGITMQDAGALIELIQMPVGTLVEDIDGTRLVHADDVTVRGEILILLHSHYPARVAVADILSSMSGRSAGSVRNELGRLRAKKLVHGDAQAGYRLTAPGHNAAAEEICHCRAA
jgi:hypothetical protein